MQSRVGDDVVTPVASDTGERSGDEILKCVSLSGCNYEILRRLPIEHPGGGIDIFRRPAPIARDVQHAELDGAGAARRDLDDSADNLLSDVAGRSQRRFVVEQQPIANKQAVSLPIVCHRPK